MKFRSEICCQFALTEQTFQQLYSENNFQLSDARGEIFHGTSSRIVIEANGKICSKFQCENIVLWRRSWSKISVYGHQIFRCSHIPENFSSRSSAFKAHKNLIFISINLNRERLEAASWDSFHNKVLELQLREPTKCTELLMNREEAFMWIERFCFGSMRVYLCKRINIYDVPRKILWMRKMDFLCRDRNEKPPLLAYFVFNVYSIFSGFKPKR